MCVLIMGLARSGPTGLPTGRGRPQQKEKVVPAQSEYSANTAHHKHKYSRLKIQIQHIINMNMARHKYRLAYNTPEAERGLPQNTTHGRCHRHSTKLVCAFMVQCHGLYSAQHTKKSTNAFSSNPMLVLCLMTPSGCKASAREDKMMGGTVQ